MGNRWIILVNKSPKGPLSTEEIQALLAQNLIRRNDLAYEVLENTMNERGGKITAEWKFLWQFDCFDRRKDEKLSTDPEKLTEAQRNRRVAPSEEELKKEVEAALPEEFSSIQPEELVIKLTDKFKTIEDPERDLAKFNAEEYSQSPSSESGIKGIWLGMGVLLIVVGLGVGYLKNLKKGTSELVREGLQLPLSVNENRSPAVDELVPPPPPPPPTLEEQRIQQSGNVITSVIGSKPRESKPDAGEIPLDEYRKLREERLEKERKEEEERLKADQKAEQDEGEGDEEEGSIRKSKKKSKKRKISAEEEEGDGSGGGDDRGGDDEGAGERE